MKRRVITGIIASIACLGLFSACNDGKQSKDQLYGEIDSLSDVNSNYSKKLAEMDSLISEVLVNFEQINSMEGMINLEAANEAGLQKSQADKIRDNMSLINQKMQKNRETIEALQKQLNSGSQKNKAMSLTIQTLQSQFNEKMEQIEKLREELNGKNIIIAEQSVKIETLEQAKTDLETTTQQQASQINDLYQVRYCIGTNSDLKEMNILRNGQVATDDYTAEYFTTIDLRRVKSIPLYSKRAELLTKHPVSSYELVPGRDKQLTLEIKNAEDFWSLSKILVIKVK